MIALVHDLLRHTARQLPSHPAIIDSGRVLTFGELDEASEHLAHGLRAAGIARGDRVAVCLENSAELVISLFGILKAGGVYVAINPTGQGPQAGLHSPGLRRRRSDRPARGLTRGGCGRGPSPREYEAWHGPARLPKEPRGPRASGPCSTTRALRRAVAR